jgi:hypothetical protein
MYTFEVGKTLLTMTWKTHQVVPGWVALIASISLLFSTIGAWTPAYIVSNKKGNSCDQSVRDNEGNIPICPTVTPPRHPPPPNEDTPRRSSGDT